MITCEWGRGPDPASGCDEPATGGGLCPRHAAALAALEANAPDQEDHAAAGVIAGLVAGMAQQRAMRAYGGRR